MTVATWPDGQYAYTPPPGQYAYEPSPLPVPLPPARVPLSFDFDGVLRKGRGYRWHGAIEVDAAPVREAIERGYAVHVLTVNDVGRVAAALRREGIDATADDGRDPWMIEWRGGSDGTKVLVTNRKLKARAYVDDRALHWRYGDGTGAIWAELDRRYPPMQAPASGWIARLRLRLAAWISPQTHS